jgi:hypothetical protein
MSTRARLLVGLTVLLMWCLPLPAASATQATWHHDPDDTRGDLDIRRAGMVVRSGRRVTINIKTFERIHLLENGELWALLDARGGRRWDYGFHIHFDTGSDDIYCDWRTRKGQADPSLTWSVHERTAVCRFDADEIPVNKPVRWRVFSTGPGPSDFPKPRPSEIVDRAPDRGWFPGADLS